MDSSGDEFQLSPPCKSKMRRVYLITYSRADMSIFPTRQSFGEKVIEYFNSGSGKVKVEHWVCCKEPHPKSLGFHYHLAVKLSGPMRWSRVKDLMTENYGVVLHFSDLHENYYSAYKYVVKEDGDVHHSNPHPNLQNTSSPKTKKCVQAYREKSRKRALLATEKPTSSRKLKERRLSNENVYDILVNNSIRKPMELYALAAQQYKEGKTDLQSFILARKSKTIEDLIENTWRLKDSERDLERERLSRMDLLKGALESDCVNGCDGTWILSAREVLESNHISPVIFAEALRELLEKGRGKYRNIMLIGPANCGKTFLLDPLREIYKCFLNPSNDKYAWVGADRKEVIFLNDFRYNQQMITWKDFLLLLEGHTVNLPAPKNHFSTDVSITSDIPIFATSSEKIVYYTRGGLVDPRESEMMAVRWRVFEFTLQIPQSKQKQIKACPRCFAELAYMEDIY